MIHDPLRIDPREYASVQSLRGRTIDALAMSATVGNDRDVQALRAQLPRLDDLLNPSLAQPHRFGSAD